MKENVKEKKAESKSETKDNKEKFSEDSKKLSEDISKLIEICEAFEKRNNKENQKIRKAFFRCVGESIKKQNRMISVFVNTKVKPSDNTVELLENYKDNLDRILSLCYKNGLDETDAVATQFVTHINLVNKILDDDRQLDKTDKELRANGELTETYLEERKRLEKVAKALEAQSIKTKKEADDFAKEANKLKKIALALEVVKIVISVIQISLSALSSISNFCDLLGFDPLDYFGGLLGLTRDVAEKLEDTETVSKIAANSVQNFTGKIEDISKQLRQKFEAGTQGFGGVFGKLGDTLNAETIGPFLQCFQSIISPIANGIQSGLTLAELVSDASVQNVMSQYTQAQMHYNLAAAFSRLAASNIQSASKNNESVKLLQEQRLLLLSKRKMLHLQRAQHLMNLLDESKQDEGVFVDMSEVDDSKLNESELQLHQLFDRWGRLPEQETVLTNDDRALIAEMAKIDPSFKLDEPNESPPILKLYTADFKLRQRKTSSNSNQQPRSTTSNIHQFSSFISQTTEQETVTQSYGVRVPVNQGASSSTVTLVQLMNHESDKINQRATGKTTLDKIIDTELARTLGKTGSKSSTQSNLNSQTLLNTSQLREKFRISNREHKVDQFCEALLRFSILQQDSQPKLLITTQNHEVVIAITSISTKPTSQAQTALKKSIEEALSTLPYAKLARIHHNEKKQVTHCVISCTSLRGAVSIKRLIADAANKLDGQTNRQGLSL